MTTLTVRNLDAELTELLKKRGSENGRSMEAEARAILRAALAPTPESGEAFVSRIRARFAHGGTEGADFTREHVSARAATFEQ